MSYIYFKPIPEIYICKLPQSTIYYLMCTNNPKTLPQKNPINEVAFDILTLCDGKHNFDSIVNIFTKKYNETPVNVENNIYQFINQLVNNYSFDLLKSSIPVNACPSIINEQNDYPTVATLEITNNCNLRCRHCYGSYGRELNQQLSLNQCKKIISDLATIKINILEITGGDPSVHPDISDIIRYALQQGIPKVMLLTNGVYMSNSLQRVLVENKNNIFVQIDLHSLDSSYFDWFTQSCGNLEKVKNNILTLTNEGVNIRVASIFTSKNINEIFQIAEWCHDSGVELYSPSIVTPLGRAETDSSSAAPLFLNENQVLIF